MKEITSRIRENIETAMREAKYGGSPIVILGGLTLEGAKKGGYKVAYSIKGNFPIKSKKIVYILQNLEVRAHADTFDEIAEHVCEYIRYSL